MSGRRRREHGSALILVMLIAFAVFALTFVSLQLSRAHAFDVRLRTQVFRAQQIADSALAMALVRARDGDESEPASGGGVNAAWIPFGDGECYFTTTRDSAAETVVIRAWSRVALTPSPSASTVAPDDPAWDGTGWLTRGVELYLKGTVYEVTSPMFVGNGGIERPRGGFAWGDSVDPFDSSTWEPVTNPSSYQTDDLPFEVSALDHPADYLQNGGTPVAATDPHPFALLGAQTEVGQFNTIAWFQNSSNNGNPITKVTPPISFYSDDFVRWEDLAFEVDPGRVDVQTLASTLWNANRAEAGTTILPGGDVSGSYGSAGAPALVFVDGNARIREGAALEGTGILVIQDAVPGATSTTEVYANLDVRGRLEWSGLVILAGSRPSVRVSSTGISTILGGFLAEDSAQTGGEVSLDSASVIFRIAGPFRLLYSSEFFQPGGIVQDQLPATGLTIVGSREL